MCFVSQHRLVYYAMTPNWWRILLPFWTPIQYLFRSRRSSKLHSYQLVNAFNFWFTTKGITEDSINGFQVTKSIIKSFNESEFLAGEIWSIALLYHYLKICQAVLLTNSLGISFSKRSIFIDVLVFFNVKSLWSDL